MSQSQQQNPSYSVPDTSMPTNDGQASVESQQQPSETGKTTNNDAIVPGMDLTPQTVLILAVMMLLGFIILCLVVGYCVRYRNKKRESERNKAELRKQDRERGTLDSPVHHNVPPIYVREIKAATLHPHDEHLKTDTITTGGTHDYMPTRQDFSDNVDLFIPQYASTAEEVPPYQDRQHLAPHHNPGVHAHHKRRGHGQIDRQYGTQSPHKSHHGQKGHHHHGHQHHKKEHRNIRHKFGSSRGRNSMKYRQTVQEEEEHTYDYGGYGYEHSPNQGHDGHQGMVLEDEDVIRYNDRDNFIR